MSPDDEREPTTPEEPAPVASAYAPPARDRNMLKNPLMLGAIAIAVIAFIVMVVVLALG